MRLNTPVTMALCLSAALACLPAVPVRAGDVILNFGDIPDGTHVISSPYTSQGFLLTSTSGGFSFNSPDTGNGFPQPVGNNPFYAGANGLAAFAPGTITISQISGDPFSLLSIDLARNFAFDLPPATTFSGTLMGGGTVTESVAVSTSSPPLVFQSFDLTGFTNVTSVSWEQAVDQAQGIHQFANIHLFAGAVPEPPGLVLLALGAPLAFFYANRLRRRG
jgi:hypothetical protein